MGDWRKIWLRKTENFSKMVRPDQSRVSKKTNCHALLTHLRKTPAVITVEIFFPALNTLLFRMTRIIAVVDMELEKMDWHLRREILEISLLYFLNKKQLNGNFQLKKTHMKGYRIVLPQKRDGMIFLEKNNLLTDKNVEIPTMRVHSESNYASIFFVDWPIDSMKLLPEIENY